LTLKDGTTHNLTEAQDKEVLTAWNRVWVTLEPHELRIDEVLEDGSTKLVVFDANDIDSMDSFYFMSGGPGNPHPT
jgi:hypothetical protein